MSSNNEPVRQVLKKLVQEMERAQKLHPSPSFEALVEEVGEAAKAAQEEGPERFREELLQVACVAIRLYLHSQKPTYGRGTRC